MNALDPDLLFFSGDQIYERNGGYGIIRRPAGRAIPNYLRKFYLFGWAFGDVMRDRPTLCLPDDHDVFQGNIWGEGGKPMTGDSTSSRGGYIEPPEMVQAVHKTTCSHHPDPFDPTPTAKASACTTATWCTAASASPSWRIVSSSPAPSASTPVGAAPTTCARPQL